MRKWGSEGPPRAALVKLTVILSLENRCSWSLKFSLFCVHSRIKNFAAKLAAFRGIKKGEKEFGGLGRSLAQPNVSPGVLSCDLQRQPVSPGHKEDKHVLPSPGWLQDLGDSLTPLSLSFLHCEMGMVVILPGVPMMTTGSCLQRALSLPCLK